MVKLIIVFVILISALGCDDKNMSVPAPGRGEGLVMASVVHTP